MPDSGSVTARRRGERSARTRAHLAAVPAQSPALVAAVEPAPAETVARDAQLELVAVANALHDGPVQSLIAASLALQRVERTSSDAAAAPGLTDAREALDDALGALRTTMAGLKPPGVAGGLGGMLTALRERVADLRVDDRATGAVSAELTGAVFRLLAALGATEVDLAGLAVVTRDRPGVVLCEVRLRGADAAARSGRESVVRALRRLDALGARATVARATGGADLLLALPADTRTAPAPALGPALPSYRGLGRTGDVTTLALTGSEDWR